MSILRVNSAQQLSQVPLPPGMLFIGDNSYGSWKKNRETENLEWHFFRSFKNIPQFIGLGSKHITYQHYEKAKEKIKLNKPFFGLQKEFGTNGELTEKSYPDYFKRKPRKISIKEFFLKYLQENFYNPLNGEFK